MNLLCGINPVLEALSAGTRHFDRLLIAKGLRSRRISEAISRASQLAIPLRFETRETLDRMAGGVTHQGLIAVVSPRPASSLGELLEEARDPALFVVLDGVEDPRNLGAILRTAEAAGSDGVLLPDRHNAGLSDTVSRASAGALEHVRLGRIGNVVQALETLKSRGIWVVGFDASGSERWDAVDYVRPIALVLGGEGRGIRRLVREHCDHLVSLPLLGHVSSLNVSVAAGVALYEVIRQRGLVPSLVKPIQVRPALASEIVGPRSDDAEPDPGADSLPSTSMKLVGLEADDQEDAGPGVRVVTVHEEEAAWAGPTVLRPLEFRRGRPRSTGGGRKGKPRPGGEREAPPIANGNRPDGPPLPTVSPGAGPDGREHQRGRRRRRRGRPRTESGAPPASASREGAAPPETPAQRMEDAGRPVTHPEGRGGRPLARGRRRRRRRR